MAAPIPPEPKPVEKSGESLGGQIRRLDFTVMMGSETGASRKLAMLFGYQKVDVPACMCCFKTWPEVDHFLITGKLTMCAPCMKKSLETK